MHSNFYLGPSFATAIVVVVDGSGEHLPKSTLPIAAIIIQSVSDTALPAVVAARRAICQRRLRMRTSLIDQLDTHHSWGTSSSTLHPAAGGGGGPSPRIRGALLRA